MREESIVGADARDKVDFQVMTVVSEFKLSIIYDFQLFGASFGSVSVSKKLTLKAWQIKDQNDCY